MKLPAWLDALTRTATEPCHYLREPAAQDPDLAPPAGEPRTAVVALAGNPNSGKTSVFNGLTGSTQHVANFPGVTVERKEGRTRFGRWTWTVVDLPGTYSLSAYSIEEIVARDVLVEERPDLVVDVLDASNLQRNLYLATQLLELGLPLVLAANMLDVAWRRGHRLDLEELGRRLGVPVVAVAGHQALGLGRLKAAIARTLEAPLPPGPIRYGAVIETALAEVVGCLGKAGDGPVPVRWLALRLLEGESHAHDLAVRRGADAAALTALLARLQAGIEAKLGQSVELALATRRHAAIQELIESCRPVGPEPGRRHRSDLTDQLLLHRWLGLPIFLGLMYLIFELTFTLGETPMGWIEDGFALLSGLIDAHWPWPQAVLLKSLVLDGVIGGVGGVLVFLPNIILLFFGLTLMEDTGYMARAAFLMDRLMERIGLHGKSFIPLLTGFGCSIPGIMGTRVLENQRDRLLTMLVLPLMSCGARLPIYLLIIPAFFPASTHGRMLFLIYAIGVLLAVGMAKLLRISVLKGEQSPFVMELPPYKWPTLLGLWSQVRLRAWLYLRKAGTLILGVSILLWAMASWPAPRPDSVLDQAMAQAQLAGDEEAVRQWKNREAERALEASLLGRVGQALTPVMAPLGFDWRISSSMLGAFAAKELFVAQLGVVYALGETEPGSESLRRELQKRYTPLVGFCIMLFALVSTPCMSTFAVTAREAGSLRWAWFQLLGLTALAWILTFGVFQIGRLLGL
ncbi:MAG: ferrous iron transport protein B [bacterium]|nr:ferrous iron transport protein B [bacterium]